jgi:hypothetical protein
MGRPIYAYWIVAAALAFSVDQPAKASDPITVFVDEAMIAKLPERVTTIVIGNPLIADVSIQSGGIMVVTGKGYGTTNLLALDRAGNIILEKPVRVQGTRDNVLIVYRGVERETYSCQPKCERRITLGDGTDFFNSTLGQSGTRATQAQGAAPQNR